MTTRKVQNLNMNMQHVNVKSFFLKLYNRAKSFFFRSCSHKEVCDIQDQVTKALTVKITLTFRQRTDYS